MEKTFNSLLIDFINENGKEILDQPDRFKSLFMDYSFNEYNAETKIFKHFLETSFVQEIKTNKNVDEYFLSNIIDRFQQTFLYDKKICKSIVFTYSRIFRSEGNQLPVEKSDNKTDLSKSIKIQNDTKSSIQKVEPQTTNTLLFNDTLKKQSTASSSQNSNTSSSSGIGIAISIIIIVSIAIYIISTAIDKSKISNSYQQIPTTNQTRDRSYDYSRIAYALEYGCTADELQKLIDETTDLTFEEGRVLQRITPTAEWIQFVKKNPRYKGIEGKKLLINDIKYGVIW